MALFKFGKEKAISSGTSGDGRGCLLIFGGVFVIAGGAIMQFFFFIPMSQWVMAQNWEPIECQITQSYVQTHSGDDGNTYSIEIDYVYKYNGQEYYGDRYSFSVGSSSGYDSKRKVVRQYPVGSTQTCYVNPSTPEESVITIEFRWSYLIGLFGLIFLVAGLFVMFGKFDGLGKGKATGTWKKAAAKQQGVDVEDLDIANVGSITLKPSGGGRWGKLFGAILFVAIWDGVSGALVYAAWDEAGIGIIEIFAFIFGGIGVLLLLWIPFQILALFNPIPELTLTPGILPLGGTATLRWGFKGGMHRLNKLSIHLVGKEEATYQQGTDTRTATNIFMNMEIAIADNPADMQRGEVQFQIPPTAMHSFEASRNKIKWHIKLHGDIPKWPDISDEFPVVVRPLTPEEIGGN